MAVEQPQKSVAETNATFWDSFAPTYDADDWAQSIRKAFTEEFRKRVDWYGIQWAGSDSGREVRMLDFACGPGMASFALLDRVDQVRGLDITPSMVEEFNKRAQAAGFSKDRISATKADLLASDPKQETAISSPEFYEFDIAVISFALHHMENPKFTIQRLVERVKPGGVVVVLDWTNERPIGDDGKPIDHSHGHGHHGHHGHHHWHAHGASKEKTEEKKTITHGGVDVEDTITHNGFSEEDMKKMFNEAGCDETGYVLTEELFRFKGPLSGQRRQPFFAKGRKAGSQ